MFGDVEFPMRLTNTVVKLRSFICALLFIVILIVLWNKWKTFTLNANLVRFSVVEPGTKMWKKKCAEICETDRRGKPGKYFDVISKKFDCPNLFEGSFDLQPAMPSPPNKIPKSLMEDYTYQGRIPVDYFYIDSSQHNPDKTHRNLKWSANTIENWRSRLRHGQIMGSYDPNNRQEIFNALKTHFQGSKLNALVIGSQSPWIEVMALEAGFETVWTLEYMAIVCDHKQIRTMLPSEMDIAFLNGSLPQFDAIISFSSLEHSGLGRYGDPLNPFGDLITMAKAWCMAKPGGRAIIGVPTGRDAVCFNACKLYGPLQLAHLFANWEQVFSTVDVSVFDRPFELGTCNSKWGYQPVHVVQKPATH